jgi:hypothetical protein
MITFFISFTIYCFMTKIIARKTIAKKEVLVPVCEWSSWWNDSFELILVRKMKFMLVIISFLVVALIFYGSFDGSFENIGIAFRIFFIFLLRWLCDLSACISLGNLRILSKILVLFSNFKLLFNWSVFFL